MRLFVSRALAIAAASLGVTRVAAAQPSPTHAPAGKWSFTIDVGGFVEGNGHAVTSWLRRNAYGVTEPKQCGFDILLSPVCDDGAKYPRVEGSGILAGMASVRRGLSDRWSVELLAATEQGGVATGRCDDLAVPKDPRCTNRFMEVPFGGGSFALVGAATTGHFHLAAGPALMLANWRMKPAHLSGVWIDATFDRDPSPFFARAQYRVYRSTTLAPESGFSGFHPSTLFIGLGFSMRTDNVGM